LYFSNLTLFNKYVSLHTYNYILFLKECLFFTFSPTTVLFIN